MSAPSSCMEQTLAERGPWLLGAKPTLADINLMPFAARLSYLGLLDAWTAKRPRGSTTWWARVQEWPSFSAGLHDLITEAEFAEMRTHGPKIRADVEALMAGLRAGQELGRGLRLGIRRALRWPRVGVERSPLRRWRGARRAHGPGPAYTVRELFEFLVECSPSNLRIGRYIWRQSRRLRRRLAPSRVPADSELADRPGRLARFSHRFAPGGRRFDSASRSSPSPTLDRPLGREEHR